MKNNNIVDELMVFFDGTKSWNDAKKAYTQHTELLDIARENWINYKDKDIVELRACLEQARASMTKLGRALS